MIGQTISHYKIVEKLGEGGMGVVYKAEDTKLKRVVALKFLSPQAVGTEEDKARFVNEAQAAASLNHPNICTIHEIDEHDGQPFIAMECIDGKSLKTRIESGPLPLDDAVKVASQIAEGLREAHDKGIVHRDIKPANIMITTGGQAKIMDFGLARAPDKTRLTKDGSTVGTVAYMSPEQARGDETDPRSDIWSLGVVLYEMLAGMLPFKGGHEQAIMYSILNEDPRPLADGVPAFLASVVNTCLEKDPSGRYQRVDDLIDDLEKATAPKKGITASSSRVSGLSPLIKAILYPSSKTDGAGGPPAKPKSVVMRAVGVVAFCAVIAVIFALIYPYIFAPVEKKTHPQTPKIAVLFFENLGPPDHEYFADGVTEELIARLAKVEGLGVIARTSVAQYKDTKKTIGDIGEELDVDYVLEGSIRWQRVSDTQSRVRITPQLIRASDEMHMWAEMYDRDLTDIFAIQSEIAGHVAAALNVALLETGEKGPRVEIPTANMDAYRAYLEGRFWWNKRTGEGFDKAIRLFDEAIRIDPDYALAYAGKAEGYCMLGIHLARPGECMETARAAARKALEIDDSLPQAHSALGWVEFMYDRDFEAAERSFRRAITIDSGYATAYNWMGVLFGCIGRHEDALEFSTRAQQLDPGSLIINRDLACVLSWIGRIDEAEQQLKKTIAMDPDFVPAHQHLGRIYAARGQYKKALAEFETSKSIDPSFFNLDCHFGYTYGKMGRHEESRQVLEELLARKDTQQGKAAEIALVYLGLGQTDEVFEWYEQAVDNREFAVILFDVALWLHELRPDPRFAKLRSKIGLTGDTD